jgi:hypothetical protein
MTGYRSKNQRKKVKDCRVSPEYFDWAVKKSPTDIPRAIQLFRESVPSRPSQQISRHILLTANMPPAALKLPYTHIFAIFRLH